MNKFICHCGKVTKKDDEYTKWNHWVRCSCGDKAVWTGHIKTSPMTKFIKGVDGGFNEGLGVNIKSRAHYNQVLKERNLKAI